MWSSLRGALVALFGLALARARGREIVSPDLVVLAFLAVAVGLLVPPKPRPPLYVAGQIVLLTALAGAWAGSPDAGPILGRLLGSRVIRTRTGH
jgi:peptidoglycan/LPS O-acetylase OafA/YrhL